MWREGGGGQCKERANDRGMMYKTNYRGYIRVIYTAMATDMAHIERQV